VRRDGPCPSQSTPLRPAGSLDRTVARLIHHDPPPPFPQCLNCSEPYRIDSRPVPRPATLCLAVDQRPPKVFISYSHDSPEHADRVVALANRLRAEGVEAILDQFEEFGPPEGWPHWMTRHLRDADFVLMVCTEHYYARVMALEKPGIGQGVRWEGKIVFQYLYEADTINQRFLPVLLRDGKPEHIPDPLRSFHRYQLDSEQGYLQLYRRLTNQPSVTPPAVGQLRALPQKGREPDSPPSAHDPTAVESLVGTSWPTTVLSTRKDTPQWTNFREINLKGECLRCLGCTIVTSSPYFRFGFKLLAWGVRIFGDAAIKSQESNLIVHIGRNNWDRPKLAMSANDIFFTYSVNGIGTENDKRLFTAEPQLTASLALNIDNGYAASFFVNGTCCLTRIIAPEMCRRVVMLAWGDNEEYEVEVRDLSLTTAHVL